MGEGTDSGGGACHRLALPGKIMDAELWVGVSDQLPKRLITTLKNRPGKPQIKLDFSNWNLAAKTTDNNFAFVPSKGAVKVPMIATAEMEAAQKTNNVTQN